MLLPSAPTLECTGGAAVRMAPGPYIDHIPAPQASAGAPSHTHDSAIPGEPPCQSGHAQNGAQPGPSSANDIEEEMLLKSAAEIRREWSLLAKASSRPCEEPLRALDHWGHVLNEAVEMARDFGQVGHWHVRN